MNSQNKSIEMTGVPVADARIGHIRLFGFLLVCALPLVLAWDSIRTVFTLVQENETFSQIPLIPVVSAFLVYLNRKAIFSRISFGWVSGAALIVPGMIFVGVARFNLWELRVTNQCSLLIFGIVVTWMGAFALFLGASAFRTACFPLLFLLFTVPIPEPALSKIIFLLQEGSADAAGWFFKLGGIPYYRRDFVFVLPGVAIRVAEECSGIRSSLALLITTALAGHLFLKSTWKKLLLCAVVIPLAVLKNGLRIMTLSTLAIYVNPSFLYGNLHRRGGIVFFTIALVPIIILLGLLQKSEKTSSATAGNA